MNFVAITLNNLGDVMLEDDNAAAAAAFYRDGLLIQRELENTWAIAYLLEAFGRLALREEQPGRALRLLTSATELWTTIGARLNGFEQEQLEHAQQAACKLLSEAEIIAATEEGQAMTLEQAIAYALENA